MKVSWLVLYFAGVTLMLGVAFAGAMLAVHYLLRATEAGELWASFVSMLALYGVGMYALIVLLRLAPAPVVSRFKSFRALMDRRFGAGG